MEAGIYIGFAIMIVGLVLGVHIGIVLGLAGFVGIWLILGPTAALSNLQSLPYYTLTRYAFVVVPMFVLMGSIAYAGGIMTDLYEAANRWLGTLRGGLYMTTVAAATVFGAISGSTIASAALFSRLALPEMLRLGYNRALSAGLIAASGTLASTIPPSVILALYGILTGTPVGKLLVAGILPGIVTATMYSLITLGLLKVRPSLGVSISISYTWKERLFSSLQVWPVLIIFGVVMGGIYLGFFTPTAAGAVGAFSVLVLCLARRRLKFHAFGDSVRESVAVTSVVFMLFIGGSIFARYLALSGVTTRVSQFVTASSMDPLFVLLAVLAMYLVLGTFMETASMMVVTLPFVHPSLTALGYDPILLGVLIVIMIEVGLMTPPVGMNVYAVYGAAKGKVELEEVFKGVLPFVIGNIFVVAILIICPQIVLWLPSSMR